MSNDRTDLTTELRERAFGTDAAAFRQFFLHYDPTVRWAVSRRIRRWRELVPAFDDILQDVWFELLKDGCKRLRHYRGDNGAPFWRYLALITSRLAWRIGKRRLGHSEVPLIEAREAEADDLAAKVVQADIIEKLDRRVRETLDEIDQQIFEGYYVEGRRLKDLAIALGLRENAVHQRHRRLLDKLQRLARDLESVGGGPDLVAMTFAALTALAPAPESTIQDGMADVPSPQLLMGADHE